jgi:hypothetical protein
MKLIDMLLRRPRPPAEQEPSREIRLARARNKLALKHVDSVLREVDRVEKLIEGR